MELDLLEQSQIFGDNRLNIFKTKEYGTLMVPVTDFAIINKVSHSIEYLNMFGEENIKVGEWWIKDRGNFDTCAKYVSIVGNINDSFVFSDINSIRLCVPYHEIENISLITKEINDNIFEVICGEYPQKIVSNKQELLDLNKVCNDKLTGKSYNKCNEFSYNGKKYICYHIMNNSLRYVFLNNKVSVMYSGDYFFEVKPIEWVVDKEADIAICKKLIVPGIAFDDKEYNGNFKDTTIYKYMNEVLVNEMFNNKIKQKNDDYNKEFTCINNKIKILRRRIDDIRK